MKSLQDELGNDTLKLLLSKLPDILTSNENDVRDALATSPEQARHIAEAFEAVAELGENGRQWLGNTMARLPVANWAEQDGVYRVTPTSDASLRYLFQEQMVLPSAASGGKVNNRRLLLQELIKQLDQAPARFLPMLELKQLHQNYSILEDIALSASIEETERRFKLAFTKAERQKRRELGLDSEMDVPTPVQHISVLADEALSVAYRELEALVPPLKPGLVSDHLVARVLSNLAANRALLETARLGALAREAAEANLSLITALNSKNVFEVPEVKTDEELEQILLGYFSAEGLLSNVEGMGRCLAGDDLKATIRAAKEVQRQYLGTRASLPGAHDTLSDTLMFALALAALFQKRSTLLDEFEGGETYAAFPARGKPSRSGHLRPHAMELVKTMYSQMAFANTGWALVADQIDAYERASAYKRGCLQMLLFSVFKRWPASKLSALHQGLMRSVQDRGASRVTAE